MLSRKTLKLLNDLVLLRTIKEDQKNKKAGFDLIKKNLPDIFKIKSFCHNNNESALYYSLSDKKLFDVLLLTHIDVVNGNNEMFRVKRKGDKLYGRGVFDMKGPLSAVVESLNAFYDGSKRKINIGLLVTSDEEQGGYNGTGFLIKNNKIKANIVLVPDGGRSLNELVVEEKGVFEVELSYDGKSSHASRPLEGDNAAERLVGTVNEIIKKFKSYDKNEWKTTATLVNFESKSISNNTTPSSARAVVNFRFVSSDSPNKLLEAINEIDNKIKIKILIQGDALSVSSDSAMVKLYSKSLNSITKSRVILKKYNSACDGRFFSAQGVPVVINRPSGGDAHGNGEYISLKSLGKFSEVVVDFLLRMEKRA
jgi:succinyl-diaminopimelate desuccinylase